MPITNFNHTIDKWIDGLNYYSLDELLAKPNKESWSLLPWFVSLRTSIYTPFSQVSEDTHLGLG
jgi:isopentenyldiphosphate isomerase